MKSKLANIIIRTNGIDLFGASGKTYTFLNPVSYLKALDNKDLFGRFDGIFADGSLLVVAIRLLYGKRVANGSAQQNWALTHMSI